MVQQITEAQTLIDEGRLEQAAQFISRWAPPDVASFIVAQGDGRRPVELIRMLPPAVATEVFPHLDADRQRSIAEALPVEEARRLLHSLEPDDLVYFLDGAPEEAAPGLMQLLHPEDRKVATAALAFPKESVGRAMSPRFVAVREDWTVGRALEHIRQTAPSPESIYTIHVLDADSRLVDALELSRFVLAEPDTPIRRIMDRSFVALSPFDNREKAVEAIQKFDLTAVPVVDDEGVLLGVVTVDDVLDIFEEEITEDFQRQAAVAPFRESYPHLGAWTLFQKRVPWVAALVLVYFAASGIVSSFEATLAAELALASFIPLLMGSGGNVASQAGTLMVRALGVNTLPGTLWLKVMMKEVLVGSGLGAALGILAGLVGYLQGGAAIGLVVALSMVAIVVIANLIGFALPLALDTLGADPAVAASPFITSLTDITSLLVYLTIATQLL